MLRYSEITEIIVYTYLTFFLNFTGLKHLEAFGGLLTCCVCLDRTKNPKMLPCLHWLCMEPCLDGVADYAKRQVTCPNCRAEHPLPYNGIQDFLTNYTLGKFLELHAELEGIVCLTVWLMVHSFHFLFKVFGHFWRQSFENNFAIFFTFCKARLIRREKTRKKIMQLKWPK